MKKTLCILTFLCIITTISVAQNVIDKVPVTASLVIKYSGTSLSQKLPSGKFDSYATLKGKIFKELKFTSKTSLDDMGLDLQQDAYQFATTTDSSSCFVTMVAIKDSVKFNNFIGKNKKDSNVITAEKGFQFYKISNSVFLGWDGKLATLVVSNYTNSNYYGYTSAVSDTTAMVSVDSTSTVVESDSAAIVNTDSIQAAQQVKDSIAQEAFTKEREIKDNMVKRILAEQFLSSVYNSTVPSIQANALFGKLADKNADVNIWIDSTGLWNRLYHSYGSTLNSWLGNVQCLNVYFEANRIRVEQKVFPGNDQKNAKLFRAVFDSKQDSSFVNYVHPSDVAYLSVSLNTEAMINYDYILMKKLMMSSSFFEKDSELVDTYVDLIQIIIDEKGIADMIPGNAIFILHGLKSKTVKYTDYTYDKNFTVIPSEKTKTELSPDFTIVFDTRNEKIFDKLADLPIKLNKHTSYDYTKTGDYYTLKLGADNIVDKIYFMVKNGKCIITTSLQDVANLTYNQSSTIDAAIKVAILNSNTAAKFNVKALIKGLSTSITDKKEKKMISYLQNNIKDMTFESNPISKNTDGVYTTTAIINIDGKHKNSFEYLFNVMENLLEISANNK